MFKPPPRFKISEWAEANRHLSSDYSAISGRFSLAMCPYAREPMDSPLDPDTRKTVLMWASQLIKTTTIENIMGFFMNCDPCPILMVQPTVEMAQAWSKERLTPTIRDTPALRAIVTNERGKDGNNTIQFKAFPGGNLAIVGANAPSGLAGRPRRIVLLDEIDRFPQSAGTEGDPCALAERRTESFWNAVIVQTSTPTIKGFSRIENEFEQTDKRQWFCPCPKCGEYQTLRWSQIKWPESNPEEAWYECSGCQAHLTDADRVSMVRKGEWRATAPFNGKRGYFLNGIASPFKCQKGYKNRLHQMVAQFLEAKHGGIETLKAWTNTFLAETWEDAAEKFDHSELLARAEPYTPSTLPAAATVVTAACDVQKDRIEVEVVAIGPHHETWGIEVLKLPGDPEKEEIWQDLAAVLQKKYTRDDGIELSIYATAIDMGFKTVRVRRFIRSCGLPRVFGVLGSTTKQATLVSKHVSKVYRMAHWMVATDLAKDTIFSRLRLDEVGPRYMHFPRGFGYTEEYFRQLSAEVVKTQYIRGFPKRVYVKIRERNEALDLKVYGLALLDIVPPIIPVIREKQERAKKEYVLKQAAPPEPEKPPSIEPPGASKGAIRSPLSAYRLRRPGGFVMGWK